MVWQMKNPTSSNRVVVERDVEELKRFGNSEGWRLLGTEGVQEHMNEKLGQVVTIRELSKGTVVSIGLATKPYPPFRHIGWNRHSVGYHSDDGKYPVSMRVRPLGGHVYYTRNGVLIGNATVHADFHDYHVAVAADGPCEMVVNVGGRAFAFEAANHDGGMKC
ncbi:hypothetical protein BC829DRAFT_393973 [Chytridium lagenaria]|nr:hypothetical protein BC829DRAFT_393973 [Chytridium lagenaria]